MRRACGFVNHADTRQLKASTNVAATCGARRAFSMAGQRGESSARPRDSDQYSSKSHADAEDEHALQWDRHPCVGGSGRGEVLERQVPGFERVRMRSRGSKGIDARLRAMWFL